MNPQRHHSIALTALLACFGGFLMVLSPSIQNGTAQLAALVCSVCLCFLAVFMAAHGLRRRKPDVEDRTPETQIGGQPTAPADR